MKTSHFVARFDSATAMLQATARYLHGKDFSVLGLLDSLWFLAPILNALPTHIRKSLYIFGAWREAIPMDRLGQLRAEAIAQWMVNHYPRRRYPAVMIGSSNGAAVHLCCALGIPWLPQTCLLPIHWSPAIHPDELYESMETAKPAARRMLEANPELQLHHMRDPNQDRLTVQRMAYFRVKRLRLGKTFERFLEERLLPGGTLFLLECQRTWPTTQVDERHIFQVGGLGGIPPEEYLSGSERVRIFAKMWIAPSTLGCTEARW